MNAIPFNTSLNQSFSYYITALKRRGYQSEIEILMKQLSLKPASQKRQL